ncbi:MAG: co-chaperone GroES [Anaerolineae bacterium]
MVVTLKPLADRVVIEPLAQEEVTASGIILPETAKEKPQKGTIVAMGPGKRDDKGVLVAMEVKVGDVVLYAKYAGTELKLEGGKQVLVLRESDILAIVQ